MTSDAEIPTGPLPRAIALLTRLSILFGGTLNQAGWIIFGFGMIFFWPFAPNFGDFVPRDWTGASALIAMAEETGASVNETAVWGYVYDYELAGVRYSGRAFTTGKSFSTGQNVDIEYDQADPARSRMVGARSSHFSAWVGLITGLFALPGIVMIAFGLRGGLRRVSLLANGHFARGKLVKKTPTGISITTSPSMTSPSSSRPSTAARTLSRARRTTLGGSRTKPTSSSSIRLTIRVTAFSTTPSPTRRFQCRTAASLRSRPPRRRC